MLEFRNQVFLLNIERIYAYMWYAYWTRYRLYRIEQIFIVPRANINICEINEKTREDKNHPSMLHNYKYYFSNQ